jgi:DnaJ-like protein
VNVERIDTAAGWPVPENIVLPRAGVEAGPADGLRRVFRSLAHAHHPDHNPGDPEAARRFADIRAAYDTLVAELADHTPTVIAIERTPVPAPRFVFPGSAAAAAAAYAPEHHRAGSQSFLA